MIEPTLGQFLRGARLGYGWARSLGAFVRVSDVGPDAYMIDVRPAADLPKKPGDGSPKAHRVWYAGAGDPELEAWLLRRIAGELVRVRVQRPIVFTASGTEVLGR